MSDVSEGELLDGRYRIGPLLGRGGMGVVHRAEDEQLGRTVALKVYPAGALDGADRQQAEARSLAALTDPGIVTLFDARLDGEPAFLVMEYVDGEDLAHRLQRGPLGAHRAAELLASVAGGLAAAHARGFVHRDVKPGNILIPHDRGEARARLADFGIARLVDSARLTTTGSVLGTAAYLAPEQLRGDSASPAADVYALGLLTIECLTGEHPFPGTAIEAAMARLHRAPTIPDSVDGTWRDLLTAMTATDPATRPASSEVAALAAGLAAASAADTEARGATPAPTAVLSPADVPTTVRPAATEALPTGGAPTAVLPAGPDAPTLPMGSPRSPSAAPSDDARRRRVLVISAAAVAVLLLIVIVGAVAALGPGRAPAASSPSAGASGTPTPTPTPTASTAAAVESDLPAQVRSALAALDSAIAGQGLDDLRDRLVAAIRAGDTATEAAVLDAIDAAGARSGNADTAAAIRSATDQLRSVLGLGQADAPAGPGKGNGNGKVKDPGPGNGKKGP